MAGGLAGAGPEALYDVLCRSYSPRAEERRQAEALLQAADGSPGFPASLLSVAAEPRAPPEVRLAAAIQLKNQVRRWWAPVGDSASKALGDADKAAVRAGLVGRLDGAAATPALRAQFVEAFRLVALHDFPAAWPGLVEQLLCAVVSEDLTRTYCALLLLHRLFKQLEQRPTSRRGDLDALGTAALPVLRGLLPALLPVAAQAGPHRQGASEMAKLVLKCLYSATYLAVGEAVQRGIDAWMEVLLAVADERAVPTCRKWAFHVLFRLCSRHGNPRRCVNGGEAFAEAWASRYAAQVVDVCLREACSQDSGGERPARRAACLALLCLGEQCSKDATYAGMRPQLQQLLQSGVFPRVRFGDVDAQLWQEDPEEFVRQAYDDTSSLDDPRAAATELLERLLRHRRGEVLVPLLRFCQHYLDAHAQCPSDAARCADKYGALLILGTMGQDLLRLDPAQAGKKKKKGKARPSDGNGETVSVEEVLAKYVRPEMAGPVAFLRAQACWVYEKLAVDAKRLGPPGAARDAMEAAMRLTADAELPVRVFACTCLQAFLGREGDGEVQAAISQSVAPLLECLLRTMSEVHCEEVAEALETLVTRFPEEIVPFAAQLVGHLAAQVCGFLSAGESGDAAGGDDDGGGAESAAMGAMQTIVSVVLACVGPQGPQDNGQAQRRMQLVGGLAEALSPLLARLLRPDGVDFLEEALEILNYLTLFGPSPLPSCLWVHLPQIYQAVCGGSAPSLPLPPAVQDGWAPDYMTSFLPPLQSFIARGPPEAFLAGVWAEVGRPYPDLVYGVFAKVIHMPGLGSEKDCAAAARLAAAVYENARAPAADSWLPQYLRELWRRLPSAETTTLRRSILCAVAAMLWYSSEAFLRCTEEQQCTQQFFQVWLQGIDVVRRLRDRKLVVLGLVRLFELGCTQAGVPGLPASLGAGLPLLVRQLAAQSREVIKLRVKRDEGGGDGDGDEDSGDDGSDVDEDKIAQVLAKLDRTPDIGEEDGESSDEEDGCEAAMGDAIGAAAGLCSSRADLVDEVALLRQALQRAPPAVAQQLGAWLGGPADAWLAELGAEEQRAAGAQRPRPSAPMC